MWRVGNADEAIGWFSRKFEYQLVRRWEADSFANYHVGRPDRAPAETTMELTYNYDCRSYTMGDAWGHIAVRVDNLHETWETLMERGAADYRPPEDCSNEYAFTKFEDGHGIDLHPH